MQLVVPHSKTMLNTLTHLKLWKKVAAADEAKQLGLFAQDS